MVGEIGCYFGAKPVAVVKTQPVHGMSHSPLLDQKILQRQMFGKNDPLPIKKQCNFSLLYTKPHRFDPRGGQRNFIGLSTFPGGSSRCADIYFRFPAFHANHL